MARTVERMEQAESTGPVSEERRLQVRRASRLKEKPDAGQLGFGTVFTDHMLVREYQEYRGAQTRRRQARGGGRRRG